jgi:hypothetical protein
VMEMVYPDHCGCHGLNSFVRGYENVHLNY